MPINRFYTWFWVIYFPFCIGFYNSSSAFGYIDEFLTLFLTIYTFGQTNKWSSKQAKDEYFLYGWIMLFFLVYSLMFPINKIEAIFLDFQQQIRPYFVFYCTWLLAPKFTKVQKTWILRVMLITYAFYFVLLFSGNTSILGEEASGGIVLGRENSPVIGQMAMVYGMTYYLFSEAPNRRKTRNALIIATFGLICGKSKFIGEYVSFIGIFYFFKGKIKLFTFKRVVQLSAMIGVVLYATWTKFNIYYVEGFDKENTEEMSARPATYKTSLLVLKDYLPFGPGLGTFATNAASEYYSPLYPKYGLNKIWGLTGRKAGFIADAFYPTLAEFGVCGVILFVIFWKRRWHYLQLIKEDERYYKIGLMCMLCLGLESTADTSYLSGKGMGYFMLLGMCMGTVRWDKREKIIEAESDESDDGRLCEAEQRGSGIGHQDDDADARVARV